MVPVKVPVRGRESLSFQVTPVPPSFRTRPVLWRMTWTCERDQGVPQLPACPHHAGAGRAARVRRQPPGEGAAARRGGAARPGSRWTTTSGWSGASGRCVRERARGAGPALQLDEAERDHCYALARESGRAPRRRRGDAGDVRPALQQVLDAITDAPAWIRNGRHDVLATNQLARALYSPVLADPRRPANTARFVYLNPEAAEQFFVDCDQITRDAAAMLRLEAGRNPHDKTLIALVGELSTRSELFRQRWASQNVRFHRTGRKRLRHPVVGELELDFEAMELPVRARPAAQRLHRSRDTPTADALKLLASWAATQESLASEHISSNG